MPAELPVVPARNHSLVLDVPAEEEIKDNSDKRQEQENRSPCQGFDRITVLTDYDGNKAKNCCRVEKTYDC